MINLKLILKFKIKNMISLLNASCLCIVFLKSEFIKKIINQKIEFAFWNKLLKELYLILIKVTQSQRESDCLLHISAIQSSHSFTFWL